jgi:hypothetical protein
LIARAERESSMASWRTPAFRAIAADGADPPPIAVAQLKASGLVEPQGWVALATPVHLVAGMSTVLLPADGLLELEPFEADTLTTEFNREFGGGAARLLRGLGSKIFCVFDERLAAQTTTPDEALGRDVWAFQPRGDGSQQLRRFAAEIEMWLFDHALNAARRARGAPAISALWLWGGGAGDAPLPRIEGWAAGDDALFASFDRRTRYPAERPPKSGVVVLTAWPGTAAWHDAERDWVRPALEDLKTGQLSAIELSAGGISFRLSARALRRFWRKSRPWWQSFGIDAVPEEESLVER